MGADMAYMGTRFIATEEANSVPEYKQMLVDSTASDIVYSSLFSGVPANYLKGSIRRSGLDPDNLPQGEKTTMNFGGGEYSKTKAWRDIWGAGQGTGAITDIPSTAEVVARLQREYAEAKQALQAKEF